MVKHTQTIRWLLQTNCVSVFDHSWGLAQRLESYYLVLVLENSEHELSSTLFTALQYTFEEILLSRFLKGLISVPVFKNVGNGYINKSTTM